MGLTVIVREDTPEHLAAARGIVISFFISGLLWAGLIFLRAYVFSA